MATDGPTPPACDPEIFQNGEPVVLLTGSSNAIETWVRAVAAAAEARVDWHYSGGVAQVLHLGDPASRARVEAAITQLENLLEGDNYIMRRLPPGAAGLYRQGVTSAPEGAIAAFYEGGDYSIIVANL
jgi:hypothetical protein